MIKKVDLKTETKKTYNFRIVAEKNHFKLFRDQQLVLESKDASNYKRFGYCKEKNNYKKFIYLFIFF